MFCQILATSLTVLVAGPVGSFAGDLGHREYLAAISAYKPMQAFNHIVGEKRFVGCFLASADVCKVTVMIAMADDEALRVEPKRLELLVAAADRVEIEANRDSVLTIGCTAEADEIKVVHLSRPGRLHATKKPDA